MSSGIQTATSSARELTEAIKEIAPRLQQNNTCLIILFFSPEYCTESFSEVMQHAFDNVLVTGCSTAGEISPSGYQQHSICGISFSADYFNISLAFYDHLSELNLKAWHDKCITLHSQHNTRYQLPDDTSTFSLLFSDGLCRKEEPLVRILASAISGIPLVGGSAGDNTRFAQTFILHQKRLQSNCAVQLLITTSLPFAIFKSQSIRATEQRMVVTDAIPEKRTILEINGRPAASEYARQLGLSHSQLITDELLAAHPVVVVMGDKEYVRSIQKINPDLSLTFYCAIDTGIVIRAGYSTDLVSSLQQHLTQAQRQLHRIQTTLMFDCIMRRIELEQKQQLQQASDLLKSYHPLGFSTYGEQLNGLHVNQTCTGIVLGYPEPGDSRKKTLCPL
ncbi:FIST N-terminal domain-containing protein [Oceanospirillum sediminis]|uniref:FIST C-terminal domain-containing protein n=1 Tax=Oceanospirillum sediminis TaxID=2760088 RepID=A0A839IM27_9GAMM|nr:FIST N-terminal domain-containing protein [Oceanospirillum sediminis]MBB1485572.1 FIST C-terminal domain-containing protein [Oceanospirillum sediminis]